MNNTTNNTTNSGRGIGSWIIIIAIGFFIYQTFFNHSVENTTWESKAMVQDGYETPTDIPVNFYFGENGQMTISYDDQYGYTSNPASYHQDGKTVTVNVLGSLSTWEVDGDELINVDSNGNGAIMRELD